MKQGGYHATSSGKVLESIVESSLIAKGLQVINYKQWAKDKDSWGREVLIKHVPYDSIYKHSSKTEFLAISDEFNICTRIECKWQQASGSQGSHYLVKDLVHPWTKSTRQRAKCFCPDRPASGTLR